MTIPNSLTVYCTKCKIASTCPRRGSSPLVQGRKTLQCRVVGGYASEPVDPEALSEESARIAAKDGPCLTLAEVPTLDEDSGHVFFQTVKIFHKPVVHPRQTTGTRMDVGLTPSHARSKDGR